MSNLNKIKEEGAEEFHKRYEGSPTDFNYKGDRDNVLDWHNKQIDKVFSLAIDEVVEIAEKYKEFAEKTGRENLGRGNVMLAYDMDSRMVASNHIIEKLLSLKNKNNG